MAALVRKPLQGVLNIIRFNRQFYLMAIVVFVVLILVKGQFPPAVQTVLLVGITLAFLTIVISLLVSFYIYDLSGLYELKWIDDINDKKVLNINAGFDETSAIISNKFPRIDMSVCDFYDPEKHTEISIKRARQAYPPYPKTIAVETGRLPFPENTFDRSLAILSAHEIRNEDERVQFFKELNRITKPSGRILVTEHLRDRANFLAYTIGFFHFHSKATWFRTFRLAGLMVKQEIKITPFISTFILENNDTTG